MIFKEGQWIKMKENCYKNKKGQIYKLHYGDSKGNFKTLLYARDETDNSITGCNCSNIWELVDQPKPIFKVGDKVRVITYINTNLEEIKNHKDIGSKWSEKFPCIKINYENFESTYGSKENLTTRYPNYNLIEAYQFLNTIETKEKTTINKTNNIMNTIKTFIADLKLSTEDKLLRKNGLQDECGNPTTTAKELVIDKLVEENKPWLVEMAKKLEEEKEKSK